ncbi:MAG: hypothetical protein Phyf2KO_23510 [Phycisphaerales bacterium]
MTNRRMKLTLALASALLAGHSAAQASVSGSAEGAATAQNLPDGFEILERHVEAVGGEKLNKKFKAVRMSGVFEMAAMNLSGPIVMSAKAPSSNLIQIDFGAMGKVVQGTDGKSVWSAQPGQEPQLLEGDAAEIMKNQSGFYSSVEPRKTYTSAETVAIVDHDGTQCYKVNLITSWDQHQVALYEVESGLLRKMSIRAAPGAEAFTNETEFLDYKEIKGIKHARKLIVSNMGMNQTIAFDSVELDPEFESGHFDPPGKL